MIARQHLGHPVAVKNSEAHFDSMDSNKNDSSYLRLEKIHCRGAGDPQARPAGKLHRGLSKIHTTRKFSVVGVERMRHAVVCLWQLDVLKRPIPTQVEM